MNFRFWMILSWLGLVTAAVAETPGYRPRPYVSPSADSPLVRLGMSDIMSVVFMNKPAIVQCITAQHEKEPQKRGKLEMSWAIRKDGTTHKVKCATPELCNTLLAKCLTKEIRTWTFPRHEIEGEPTVFPFSFIGPESIPEQLSSEDIFNVVSRKQRGLRRCIDDHKKDPPSTGQILMSWAIRKDGTTHKVKCATPELCDEPLAQCWVKVIKTWTFPRHKIEGEPTVMPFKF